MQLIERAGVSDNPRSQRPQAVFASVSFTCCRKKNNKNLKGDKSWKRAVAVFNIRIRDRAGPKH